MAWAEPLSIDGTEGCALCADITCAYFEGHQQWPRRSIPVRITTRAAGQEEARGELRAQFGQLARVR